ncbi:MAG: hypothetical protein ACYC2O_02395 [Microthrixaceae bacterium]
MHRRLLALTAGAALLVAVVACVPDAPNAPGGGATSVGPCPMFPADNFWNADVRNVAAHPSSVAWRSTIGAAKGLKADFGSGTWDGGPIGIPFNTVGAGQPLVGVGFDYADESDPGPYPIAPGSAREHGADHHVLTVDTSTCTLYELFAAEPQPNGTWHAGSGARFDLRSNALRPAGWTSADAAGLAILPGLVRYEEVAAGRIDHAIRFTAPATQRRYDWPATHYASSSTDPNRPPMGAWFRLRADYDTSWMSPQSRVIAEALKTHGMILADNGSSWYLSGAPDERWDNQALRELASIKGTDLTAIDASTMMVHPWSGQSRT